MSTGEPPAGGAGGQDPAGDRRAALPIVPPLGDTLRAGACTGVGSLPHRSVHDAAAFALRDYDVPAIPTLPRRSPAEGMIAQALVGITGVTLGQYGSIAVDADRLDPAAPVETDIGHDAYGGLRAFLADAAARQYRGPVKWQFTGPVTLGAALTRVGVPADRAFAVAAASVRAHVAAIATAVAAALPELAADRVVRRAVVRRADEPGLPDRPRPGDRPPVDGDGDARAGRHRRRPLLRRGRHRVAAGRRPGDAVGPARDPAGRRRRLPDPLPRRWRAHRVGRDPDRRTDRRRPPTARGACSRTSGASW